MELFVIENKSSENDKIINNVICEMIVWVEKNISGSLKGYEVAKKSGYTRWYFQRKFKEVTGISLLNYISQVRADKCKMYIECTDLGYEEIAELIGFRSVITMIRTMQKHYNMTPNEIRLQSCK